MIAKDPEWQKLKINLSEKWSDPAMNIRLLRAYLDDFSDGPRLRRVINYLTGFRSDGSGQKEICELLKDIKFKHTDFT